MRFMPLLVIPLALYNAFAFVVFQDYQADFREAQMFAIPMVSGVWLPVTVSTTIILLALALLGVEVIKATRIGSASVVDHILATLLFIAFLIEFLLVPEAATNTFVILMAIALVDLLCGFAVSLKSATRDVTYSG